ncbi:hypothetical protein METBIDRAFT_226840 [Metschnikowia bicuspidata var. bicuspidata NRRL YB-4993]|uniref:TMEM205-like domain-containing protein n=1 Tax=Metschnikowia bicuspidata var. bicuspidata NRRL YB-4993 TaxID=869754 RepID=A0A1A0H1W5_9ASCO|nr:hypothetical protein METBIDRAFT_226840 [Metschnikowia bicuspidata var. bicuspidata NRRL YB-4993]OBA18021.1 hypothetical protein METBIDRAFT_226840 [Metschnikowia bicuspidata var. bicuspidata NRRL YB-4993]
MFSTSAKSAVNVILFSVAFGGGVMHSFIVSPIAFKHLPREEFGKLQHQVLPLYLLSQAAAPVLLSLTTPLGSKFATPVLAASAVAGALNYFWVLPRCNQIKAEKKKLVDAKRHEQIIDGNTVETEEFKALSKQFGKFHGISSLLNLLSLVTLGAYGVALGRRIL